MYEGLQRTLSCAGPALKLAARDSRLRALSHSGVPLRPSQFKFVVNVCRRTGIQSASTRYADFIGILNLTYVSHRADALQEPVIESRCNDLRLVIAHDPPVALEAGAKRDRRIEPREQQAAQWTGKLDAQDSAKNSRKVSKKNSDQALVKKIRGRKLSEVWCTRCARRIWRASSSSTSRVSCSATASISALWHARV